MLAAGIADEAEIAKFESLAHGFWDTGGPFRTLHDIDPTRCGYIAERMSMSDSSVADVGCGGGLLAESLTRLGARVTAIDLSASMIGIARLHAQQSQLAVDYRLCSVETLAAESAGRFDAVCCMEMIEHVADPAALLASLAQLLRPGGMLFMSTINRGPRAFLSAIVAAEYLLQLVPKGTHEYLKLVRPAELARYARDAGLSLRDVTGLSYNPLTRTCRLGVTPEVNYLASFVAPAAAA
jgi:2-polyprenyl-6-hydroxyphenyl methylase / 3-demethylubiquinone-9 3-methyltransferase